MAGKTRVVKSLCMITLLALPSLVFSMYFIGLLFNNLYLSFLNLEDWVKYLLLSLICMNFLPVPPPSKKRVQILHKTLISHLRKFLHQKTSENWVICDNLQINSMQDDDLRDLVPGLNQAVLYNTEHSNSCTSTHLASHGVPQPHLAPMKTPENAIFLIRQSFLSRLTALLLGSLRACKATFLKFEGVALDFLKNRITFHLLRVELT